MMLISFILQFHLLRHVTGFHRSHHIFHDFQHQCIWNKKSSDLSLQLVWFEWVTSILCCDCLFLVTDKLYDTESQNQSTSVSNLYMQCTYMHASKRTLNIMKYEKIKSTSEPWIVTINPFKLYCLIYQQNIVRYNTVTIGVFSQNLKITEKQKKHVMWSCGNIR